MKIACIGGGPAGLYFSILMKQLRPDDEIVVYERNRADDTFGWGVVFSDETLGNFGDADAESYRSIQESFVHWTDIKTWYRGEWVRSTGHGFSGLARKQLLAILIERAGALGVELAFETDADFEVVRAEADLVVAADGINSTVREALAEKFEPEIDWRKCRFAWLGTTLPMDAFTFVFAENEHGLFMVHAYPFERTSDDGMLGTWIVECHEDTWKAAGLDQATEEETVAYCQNLFEPWLEGHPLLSNRSIWRSFPTVRNARWHNDKVVLLGDAAHSAHFSIGSGTKLAMEDSIALARAFEQHPGAPVPEVLEAYQEARYVETLKTQKAAQTSLEWFENAQRYRDQDPVLFKFNLMTRSKRITYENLALRDPDLVTRATEAFGRENGLEPNPDGSWPKPMFAPLEIKDCRLENRVVVSAMCQYSAIDGTPNDWHLVHLGARAVGGAGLLFTEATSCTPEGRITPGCTGLYSDENEAAWKRIVEFAHSNSAVKIGLQLGHAGRKASCSVPWEGDTSLTGDSAWPTLGPSADPFRPDWHVPKAMDRDDMDTLIAGYVSSTQRALACGFDILELHMAHGYLLSSFLSPASNKRTDEYGGSLQNRLRFPLEVTAAVRAVWPVSRPLFARISATDWLDHRPGEGLEGADAVVISAALVNAGVDVIDVSSGGNTPDSVIEFGRMYQLPFAERIRYEVGCRVMAVGAIQGPDHCNTILAAGRADLCAMARPHLTDPHLTLRTAAEENHQSQFWPVQYLAAKPRPKR